jgi:hypothetical protein
VQFVHRQLRGAVLLPRCEMTNSSFSSLGAINNSNIIDLDGVRVRRRTRPTIAWMTRPEAEFFNSLCPVGSPTFPQVAGLSEHDRAPVESAFRAAFRYVRDQYESGAIERCSLTKAEQLVIAVIARKTLSFGKLFEKISQRIFENGDTSLNVFGNTRLVPVNVDNSSINKGIRGLVEKGLIGKFPADAHPVHGRSVVFCPLPLRPMLLKFWEGISIELHQLQPYSADAVLEAMRPVYVASFEALEASNEAPNQSDWHPRAPRALRS